jgi:hypothetical protein
LGISKPTTEHAFHSPQVYYVGTILPKMSKIVLKNKEEAVIGACDKPVVFYKAKDLIEM